MKEPAAHRAARDSHEFKLAHCPLYAAWFREWERRYDMAWQEIGLPAPVRDDASPTPGGES